MILNKISNIYTDIYRYINSHNSDPLWVKRLKKPFWTPPPGVFNFDNNDLAQARDEITYTPAVSVKVESKNKASTLGVPPLGAPPPWELHSPGSSTTALGVPLLWEGCNMAWEGCDMAWEGSNIAWEGCNMA